MYNKGRLKSISVGYLECSEYLMKIINTNIRKDKIVRNKNSLMPIARKNTLGSTHLYKMFLYK